MDGILLSFLFKYFCKMLLSPRREEFLSVDLAKDSHIKLLRLLERLFVRKIDAGRDNGCQAF